MGRHREEAKGRKTLKPPEEVLEALQKAIDEAKETIRELHGARAAALDIVKKQKQEIREAIRSEVGAAIQELRADTKEQLERGVGEIVSALRERLGL